MLASLQLQNFYLTKLRIEKHQPASNENKGDDIKIGFDFDIRSHVEDDSKFRVILAFSLDPEEPYGNYFIEAEITGIFVFMEDLDLEKKMRLLHVNGLSILYGILRGEIAMATGSFPGQRLNLPSLNILEVLRAKAEAEKQKHIEAHNPSPSQD